MTSSDLTLEGCGACWPASRTEAQSAQLGLVRESKLVNESHFQISILKCGHCSQRFVYVFTEMIDWRDGDDPAYRIRMPITGAEAEALTQRGEALDQEELMMLGPDRRSLDSDTPSMQPERVFWGMGVPPMMHD